jgi:phospholipid N-methyltransferase
MSVVRRLSFARALAANPRAVGAVAPSSRRLAAAMVAELPMPAGRSVLELGPGTGPFTAAIRERLAEPGLYLGIEQHGPFVEQLRERFPELAFAHGSAGEAARLHGEGNLPPVGAIVSGLPFASLPAEVQDQVLAGLEALLPAGAYFTTFQYAHAGAMPAARRFRRQMAAMLGPPVRRRLVLANLPPAHVLRWQRGA